MSTFSVTDQLLESFRASKVYRHAFVEERVRTAIAAQIRAIREQRGFDSQTKLALEMGKTPSWISRLENPNQPPPTIPTLLELAEAFDVDLNVEFRAFSEMFGKLGVLSPNSFLVPGFKEEFPETPDTEAAIGENPEKPSPLTEYCVKGQSQDGVVFGPAHAAVQQDRSSSCQEINTIAGVATLLKRPKKAA